MAVQRVYHWKHGWIPLDQYAALEKEQGRESTGKLTSQAELKKPGEDRFAGDPGQFFGGDTHWPIGKQRNLPSGGMWRLAVEDEQARSGTPPVQDRTLGPNEIIYSSQPIYSKSVVQKYLDNPPVASAEKPKVVTMPTGKTYVIDGHHRIMADRQQGRPTAVQHLDLFGRDMATLGAVP